MKNKENNNNNTIEIALNKIAWSIYNTLENTFGKILDLF